MTVLPGILPAADYFPLQVGNTWVYRSSGRLPAQTITARVTAQRQMRDRTYYEVTGWFGATTLLRQGEDNTLYSFNPTAGTESVWARFDTPEGETYRTEINPCTQEARVVSRRARYSGPTGDFADTLQLTYPAANCADAGLEGEQYLPYVGLVRRTSTTIAGPVTFDLVYARLGGATVVTEREVSFSLALDRNVYWIDRMPSVGGPRPAPSLTARLALRATHEEPLRLTFSSGQTYEVVLRDEQGQEVRRWSEDMFFTQALREVDFTGETVWPVLVPLGRGTEPLPPGKYTAEAYLATVGGKQYASTVAFEVRYAF